MFNYPNFEQEILKVFEVIINQFKLNPVSFSTERFSELRLINEKCIIRFTYNMGELGCSFVNPDEKGTKIYPIYPVWSFLYPNDKKRYGLNEFDFEKQLYHLAELVSERFTNILMGDFSWISDFESNNKFLSRQIEFIMNKLENEDPIKIKFWNGDLSWRKDLEGFLEANKIVLR